MMDVNDKSIQKSGNREGMPTWGRTHLFSDVIGLTKCLFLELKAKRKKSEAVDTQKRWGKPWCVR
ncbi:hypothetical protein Hanom_Chr06g00510671 [Helianthus anomalus]